MSVPTGGDGANVADVAGGSPCRRVKGANSHYLYIKADAALLGRDPDQLVIDVYASGRHGMIRDELLMAKTVDFLVDQAVAVEMPAGDEESDGADATAVANEG